MKQLSSQVIQTTRSGNHQYAKVESFNRSLVTVRLGSDGTGARLTNLNVIGTPVVGDVVIVDYSTNVPYVRTLQSINESQNALPFAATPLESPAKSDILDPYSLGDGQCCGILAIMAGGSFNLGTPVYATNGGMAAAYAETIATAKVIGMSAGANNVYLIDGFINNSNWDMTAGSYLFLGVDGGIWHARPTNTDNAVTILGVALTATILRFKPELVIVELL